VLRQDGRFYDPKAVVGVAHQHTPAGNPLEPSQFDATQAIARLEALGYEVLPFSGLWWANQSGGYRDERDHGFVWAPQQTRGGQRAPHHTNVTNLRVGQRIIHYADGRIRAVGVVAEAPFTSVRPDERTPELRDRPGYLCPVDYYELPTPIPRDEIPDRSPEVGPFDVNGNPKYGYLYKIDDAHVVPLLQFLNERIPDLFADTVTQLHWTATAPPLPADPEAPADPILDALLTFKNVVLEGVPGTGKSFAIQRLAEMWKTCTGRELLSFDGRPYCAIVMHPSTSYEDFIEGLRPEVGSSPAGPWMFDQQATSTGRFGLTDGFFVTVCVAAAAAPDKDVLVLLDELNRCNVPSVFGDLLLTLEASRRARYTPGRSGEPPSARDWTTPTPARLPYSGRTFFVPDNVYVIATTNTTDRSVAPLDAALRRRFAFHRLEPAMPTGDLLPESVAAPVRELFTTSARVMRDLNDHALRPCLGPDAMLGHSYLYAAAAALTRTPGTQMAIIQLKRQWQYTVLPQLVDAVRALGAEDLLDAATREDWFAEHTDLAPVADTARNALSQFDAFLQQSLELRLVVEGTGLGRGARIAAHRATAGDLSSESHPGGAVVEEEFEEATEPSDAEDAEPR
jgi:hypothetical protein